MTPIEETQAWLEKAVIGLNLCPFAKAVHARQQIHWVLSSATEPAALLADLVSELRYLAAARPEVIDTTVLVHPQVFDDFLEFNDFLGAAEDALDELELDGMLQIAGFHPRFCFHGAAEDDIGNYTNRSPYPTLHLLREDSVARAVAAFPDPEAIYERNIETLERLGLEGWRALGLK